MQLRAPPMRQRDTAPGEKKTTHGTLRQTNYSPRCAGRTPTLSMLAAFGSSDLAGKRALREREKVHRYHLASNLRRPSAPWS
eukprot:COSAG06_NODE_45600_length_353_cov_1.137795_1_plen_81_part_10